MCTPEGRRPTTEWAPMASSPSALLLDLLLALSLAATWPGVASVGAEHRVSSYRRNHQVLFRPLCPAPTDCAKYDNAFCNVQRKCTCKTDFVQVSSFVNTSYMSMGRSMVCLPVARLDERCISHEQCIVDFAECRLIVETVGGLNRTSHFCKCSAGHDLDEHDTADIVINEHPYRVRPVCSWERSGSSAWLSTLVLISLLIIFILIGTFIALVRYQRWRNLPLPATVTSLAASPGMNSHAVGNNHLGSSSPPPMGSVEAEFQNDFIQVFPMHHLEPMPDKNAHAFIIR